MLSYILFVVVLLIAVGGVVYSGFLTTLRREVETSNVAALTQFRKIVDLRLREMKMIAARISANPQLTSYALRGQGGYASYCAVRDLNEYRSNNGFIYDLALYYQTGDDSTIYAASGTYSLDLFFGHVYRFAQWGKDGFLDALRDLKYPTMRPVETVNLNGTDPTGFAVFLCPVPVSSARPYGAVIFLIEEDVLGGIIKDTLKDYAGLVLIMDGAGTPILSVSSGGLAVDVPGVLSRLKRWDASAPVGRISHAGEQYSLVRLASDLNGWQYLTIMPTAQFMKKVRATYLVFNLTILGIFVLGITMAFFFANNSYRPWRKLAEVLRGQAGEHEREYADEISFISETIHQVRQENQGLISRLKSKAGMMKEQLLARLLYDRIQDSADFEDMMEMAGIKFTEPYFTVIQLLIDDYDGFQKANAHARQEILRYSMIAATEELCSEIGAGYGIDALDSQGLVFVLNAACDERDGLQVFIRHVKDFYQEYFNVTLTVGVGNMYTEPAFIAASYNEARTAAYYRLLMGRNQTIFYQDIKDRHETGYCYPAEQEQQLIIAIKQGDIARAEQIIEHIVAHLMERQYSPEAVRYVWFGVMTTIARVLEEAGVDAVTCLGEKIEDLMAARFETVELLENRLMELSLRTCRLHRQTEEKQEHPP